MSARRVALLAAAAGVLFAPGARSQYFSNKDGYAPDGSYRIQAELDPNLWLPATSGSVRFGFDRLVLRAPNGASTSVPAPSSLAASVQPSFAGFGIVRYGPFSAETDLHYVSTSGSKTSFTGPLGRVREPDADVSYVRVAPGLGYTAWAGNLGTLPVSVDARAGFAYFATWNEIGGLDGIRRAGGGFGSSSDFVQPWLGGRLTLVPAPRWRVTLDALAQGFGVDGGSWGWGGALANAYAVTDWFTVNLAFRALNTEREQGDEDGALPGRRSLNLTAYGPVLGVGFRF